MVALIDAATKPDADGPLVRDLRKRVFAALPRKNKEDLERVIATAGAVDLHAEILAWEAEETRRALYSAVVFSRDLRAVGKVIAADAVAAPAGDERRRALAANHALRDVLEFVCSAPCWEAFKRIYGRT
jgi:hypothetical protein